MENNTTTVPTNLNERIFKIIESIDYAIGSDDRVDVWGQEKAAKAIEKLIIQEKLDYIKKLYVDNHVPAFLWGEIVKLQNQLNNIK